MYKQAAYKEAVAFRKRGFTYSEIAKICNVSKSTVSNWLRHETFSQEVAKSNTNRAVAENKKRLSLINKARVTERRHQYREIVRLAEIEYKNYRSSPLFISGLTLYLTEGDHTNNQLIRLSNSNFLIQRSFIRFLINYLGVDKHAVHYWLLLYPDHDEVTCMKQWCKKIGLSPAQFYKNQVVTGRAQKPTLHFGVLNTIIGSTLLKKKLMHWVSLLEKELKN